MTRTACPYCGVGCGVVGKGPRDSLSITGDSHHPANLGRLCSKGAALGETVRLDGRLLKPMIGEEEVSWNKAIARVASKFVDTIKRFGPDAVAFYVSGQLLTEDYYVANKLMKGFIGSANIDTNSRLCMASAVAAHKEAFGEDVVPAIYEDLDIADLVVFCGHNAAWTHPVLHRRMERARAKGQTHIVLDPRRTDTAQLADMHLQLKAQSDVRLWNGLLAYLNERGAIDQAFIAAHTRGLRNVLRALAAQDQSITAVARDCGVDAQQLTSFYEAFANTPKTVTLFSMGVNQSADGVAKALAIINAHLATGRVSKPGASPFSITGQPNAMGGRETGGLANMLASHLEFTPEDIEIAQRFWNAPCIARKPGLKAVDLFESVYQGEIKALWIMATNPVVSMPDADRVRDAIARCPFVVVSEVVGDTDTARLAHVRLPALAWGEKSGTVTNSERRITRQRALFPAPGEARADWRIVADVASAMGFGDAFAFSGPAGVFREYAAMTAFENNATRVLDLGAWSNISDRDYEDLAPTYWPVGATSPRPFEMGVFAHADGRARFVVAKSEKRADNDAFPLLLNTGRNRDQWHTMTRTGLSPRLMRHAPEPTLHIHPEDAGPRRLSDGALCRVESPYGAAIFTASVSEEVRRGEMFAPMHWGAAFAPNARINAVVSPTIDARSGQPEFKRTPVNVSPVEIAWRGFYVCRTARELPQSLWWRRTPHDFAQLYEIAADASAPSMNEIAELTDQDEFTGECIRVSDSAGKFLRSARLRDGRLWSVFIATTGKALPPRDWLLAQFSADALAPEICAQVLSGGASGARKSPSVCACFDVDHAAIKAFALARGEASVQDVGDALKAGTNCGSCRPEIMRILRDAAEKANEAA